MTADLVRLTCRAALALALTLPAAAALADAGHSHGADIGTPGKAAQADRTVEIVAGDNFFEPVELEVKAGETIRFVIRNTGELLHEFNIGTVAMHLKHQEEMAMMVEHGMLTATGIDHEMMKMDHAKMGMPDMKHDDPNSALIEPGQTAELVWTFTKAGKLEFACNIPGHYESGMAGDIRFRN